MKKTLTILSAALITLISYTAKAQDDKEYPKSYLAFLGGISTPTGNFAKTDYLNNSAGFAKKGVTFGLEGADYVHKNFAIIFNFQYTDQGELSTADAQNLANGYNTDFKKDQTTVTGVDRYSNLTLVAGPQYSFLINKFTIDLKAEAGIIKSTSTPDIAVNFDYSTATAETFSQLSSKANNFVYGGGAGVRYSLGDTWDIGLRATYLTSDGFKIENSNNTGTIGRYVTKTPYSAIQTILSMTIKF